MRVKNNYRDEEILRAAQCGCEFEFYSNFKDHVETARSLSKFLGKRVIVPMSVSDLKKQKPLYHSPVNVSENIFKLEPDYSGGKTMCELITGAMPYADARNTIIKVLEWISNNGYTNERCSIHLNISFRKDSAPALYTIENINIPKFILSFDEEKVYDVFPARRDSVYARSIKEIRPNKSSIFLDKNCSLYNRQTFSIPSEKYYGVNFTKLPKGYLEYRYLGGNDYEKRIRKIIELLKYFVIHLHNTMNSEGFTSAEEREFKKIVEKQAKLAEGFVRYADFKQVMPDVSITYDMNNNDDVLEGVWVNIREKLYEIIMTGGMVKGEFNYDSEIGRFQLKNAKLRNCRLNDMEFIKCNIEGVIERSAFYNCEIKNSRLHFCNFVKENVVDFSKIEDSQLHVGNVCNDCFIENKTNIINSEVNRGVIRNGEIGKLAKISKETTIVEQIEPTDSEGSYRDESKKEKKAKDDEAR
jgi:hypothetical protein